MDLFALSAIGLILVFGLSAIFSAESFCLRKLSARSGKGTEVEKLFRETLADPGAPWSLAKLRRSQTPSIWIVPDPDALIIVLRGPLSGGAVVVSQGLVAGIRHVEFVPLLQQALLRLNQGGLIRATFGLAGNLNLLGRMAYTRKWPHWMYSEYFGLSAGADLQLPPAGFFEVIRVMLLSPFVVFFGTLARCSPWRVEVSHLLGLQRLGLRRSGFISLVTEGLQPQFPMSKT